MMKLRALAVISVVACAAGCGASSEDAGSDSGPGPGPKNTNVGVEPPEDGPEASSAGDYNGEPLGACASTMPPEQVELTLGDIQGAASAARAREALRRDPAEAPWPSRILPSDFLNLYRLGAPIPADGQPPAFITVEAQPRSLFSDAYPSGLPTGQWDVLVTVHAVDTLPRVKHALIAVVDTTPSMAGIGIGRAKAALSALVKHATQGDHLVILTTDPNQTPLVELDLSGQAERDEASAAVSALEPGVEAGITDSIGRAYDLAEAKGDLGIPARVILVSDGGDDAARLDVGRIEAGSKPGTNRIVLTAVGTGSSNWYRSTLLRTAAKLGRGPYVYVDSEDEAERLLGPRLREMTEVALDEVWLQLEVSGFYTVMQGVESEGASAGADAGQQYLAPGGSLTKLVRLVPCKFGATPADTKVVVTASHSQVPFSWTGDLGALKKQSHARLDKALAIDAYASALRALDPTRLAAAQVLVATALGAGPGPDPDPDLVEIQEPLARHPLAKP